MRTGLVVLPDRTWAEARPIWELADGLGFDHAWIWDHLAWRHMRDGPWFGAVPMLSAAAAVTTRVRLGTLVASINFRHPVTFAKELMTLDDISGGRMICGIGAGTVSGWDATILGQDLLEPRERAGRFAEFVDMLHELLTRPELNRAGEFYQAVEARNYPGCVQQPRLPFHVAATGPRGMRLAARHGEAWVTTGDRTGDGSTGAERGAEIIAGQVERLGVACEHEGRDPASIRRLVLLGTELNTCTASGDQWDDAVGRYGEVGVTDLVVPYPSAPDLGSQRQVFEQIFSR